MSSYSIRGFMSAQDNLRGCHVDFELLRAERIQYLLTACRTQVRVAMKLLSTHQSVVHWIELR